MNASEDVREEKRALRRELTGRRRAMNPAERERQNRAVIDHVIALLRCRPEPDLVLAAYDAQATEPGGTGLISALADEGHELLLPVSGDDGQLFWARYLSAAHTARGRLGIAEPTGPRLGTDAVAAASVILVPALGVTSAGVRMGKGGGYYDRTLAELPDSGPLTVVLLYDGEITDSIPTEAHDMPVDAAITPRGLVSFVGNDLD